MYIPMCEKEPFEIKLPDPIGLTVITLPLTGENEVVYLNEVTSGQVALEADDTVVARITNLKHIRNIMDYFVKGYIHPLTNEKVLFKDGELPSSSLGMDVANSFLHSIRGANYLSVEEKKT